ncbi:MAG: dynamin family protein [Candidatus Xenobiia bacterium LiM19]
MKTSIADLEVNFNKPLKMQDLAEFLERRDFLNCAPSYDYKDLTSRFIAGQQLGSADIYALPWALSGDSQRLCSDFKNLRRALSLIEENAGEKKNWILGLIQCCVNFDERQHESGKICKSYLLKKIKKHLNPYDGKNKKLNHWKFSPVLNNADSSEVIKNIVEEIVINSKYDTKETICSYKLPINSYIFISLLKEIAKKISPESVTCNSFISLLEDDLPYKTVLPEGPVLRRIPDELSHHCVDLLLKTAYSNSRFHIDKSIIQNVINNVPKNSEQIKNFIMGCSKTRQYYLLLWLPYYFTFIRFRAFIDESLEKLCLLASADNHHKESKNSILHKIEAFRAYIKKPQFPITMVGTTSSGKSTLLNALAGASVAPMESQEKSVGVLTLSESEKGTRMKIFKNRHDTVPYLEKEEISIDEIAKEINKEMEEVLKRKKQYENQNKEKKKKDSDTKYYSVLPLIEVELPSLCKTLLKSDDIYLDFSFKLTDLPGFKDINDENNKELISEKIKNTLSIIVFNFIDPDQEKLKCLLDEMKKFLSEEEMKCLIFVCNKFDLATENDHKNADAFRSTLLSSFDFSGEQKIYLICAKLFLRLLHIDKKSCDYATLKKAVFELLKFKDDNPLCDRKSYVLTKIIKDKIEDGEPIDESSLEFLKKEFLQVYDGKRLFNRLYEQIFGKFFILSVKPAIRALIDDIKSLSPVCSEQKEEFYRFLDDFNNQLEEYLTPLPYEDLSLK